MTLNILYRRRFWWGLVAVLALILPLTISVMGWRERNDLATAPDESVETTDIATEERSEAEAANPVKGSESAVLSGFMQDCGRPSRARERMEVDHLFEVACVTQLSTALSFLAERDVSPEVQVKLDEHRDRAQAVGRGDWRSGSQTRRMQEALVSATEVMDMLSRRHSDTPPEIDSRVAEARRAALSIREGVPLVEQTDHTDTFFRATSEALAMLGGGICPSHRDPRD